MAELEPQDQIRVLHQYVLVKQIMRKKKGVIIVDAANSEKDKFDYSFEVLQLGNKCEADIKVGDHPIFSEFVKFNGFKIIEKDNKGMISLIIVHENDIIGVDNDPQII